MPPAGGAAARVSQLCAPPGCGGGAVVAVAFTPAAVADVRAALAGAGPENAAAGRLALAVLRSACAALEGGGGGAADGAAQAGALAADALLASQPPPAPPGGLWAPGCGPAASARYSLCRRLVAARLHAQAHAQAAALLRQLWPHGAADSGADARTQPQPQPQLPPPGHGGAFHPPSDGAALALGAALCLAGAAAELSGDAARSAHAVRLLADGLPAWLGCGVRAVGDTGRLRRRRAALTHAPRPSAQACACRVAGEARRHAVPDAVQGAQPPPALFKPRLPF